MRVYSNKYSFNIGFSVLNYPNVLFVQLAVLRWIIVFQKWKEKE